VRITVLAWGGNGDVLPMLALAGGLRNAGHIVSVACPARFQKAVAKFGGRFFEVGPDPERMLDAPDMQSSLAATSGVAALRSIGRLSEAMVRGWIAGCLPASEGTDLILGGLVPGFFIGSSLSEQSGAPFLPCFIIPLTPTRSIPSFALFLVRSLGPVLNRFTHIGTAHLLWNLLLPAVNRARREFMHLPPAPRGGWFLPHLAGKKPVVYGFSRHVVPIPQDWDACNRVTGYWFADRAQDYQPSEDLSAFLDSGPPPVVVGFGSMTGRNDDSWLRISLEALRRNGRRGIILTGTVQPADVPRCGNIFVADFIPHAWIYPRAAAAVHHGGAGTTGAALRAGIPAVVVPHNFDQPFWGNRVARLGAGPPPILRRNLNARRLASAIDRATTDAEMRRRAAALGELLRAEDGVAEAVRAVEEFSQVVKK
jgi:sterol 3beta-glucosyltransferase